MGNKLVHSTFYYYLKNYVSFFFLLWKFSIKYRKVVGLRRQKKSFIVWEATANVHLKHTFYFQVNVKPPAHLCCYRPFFCCCCFFLTLPHIFFFFSFCLYPFLSVSMPASENESVNTDNAPGGDVEGETCCTRLA